MRQSISLAFILWNGRLRHRRGRAPEKMPGAFCNRDRIQLQPILPQHPRPAHPPVSIVTKAVQRVSRTAQRSQNRQRSRA